MAKHKTTFTAKFKAKVACEALNENKTINEISSTYGVHPTQIAKWKKELRKNSNIVFEKTKEKNKHKDIVNPFVKTRKHNFFLNHTGPHRFNVLLKKSFK